MKIKIIANNLNWATWDSKLQMLKDWFGNKVPLEITLEHSNFNDIKYQEFTNTTGLKYQAVSDDWYDTNISRSALVQGCDVVVFVLPPEQWKGNTVQGQRQFNNLKIEEIQMLGNENAKYDFNGIKYDGDQFFNILRHELCHAFYNIKNIKDNTHLYWTSGNLAQALEEIKNPTSNPVVLFFRNMFKPATKYKYFNQTEIDGLKPELVKKLDEMREFCGFPFIITSGYRTKAKNNSLSDAVSDSAHLYGEAVDIKCADSIKRNKIIDAIKKVGIKRYGIGEDFVHIDISTSLPQNVCWTYYK